MRHSLILLLFAMILSTHLIAQEYAVIAHKSTPILTLEQIRAIYLKKLSRINNITMVPLNLKANDPLRQSFEKHVLHMSFQRLKSYWSRQHYLGHRPPVSMQSQESALTFVNNVEGALAYIDAKNINDDLHVIYRWRD